MATNTAANKTKVDTTTSEPQVIPALSEERAKALKSTFEQIDKQCGKGSVMLLGQKPNLNVEAISTGSILVDDALGVGGLPRGRVVEIFGPEASGKTTLTLHVIAQAQKTGGVCAFIDAEHAMDPTYAESVGIDINNLIISQPDYGEQALDIAEMLIRSNAVDLVVIDSVAALVPKSELEGEMGDHHVGLQARLMSQALRKLTAIVSKSRACLVFINQVRSKINAMPFGDKETTTGGNALKFYASMRLDVRRIGALKKNDKHFGNRVLIKVVKNKLAPPFKRVEVDLIFGKGISQELSLLDAALEHGVVKQAGAWFTLGEDKLGQGRDNCHKKLEEDKDLYQTIFNQVKEKMKEKH